MSADLHLHTEHSDGNWTTAQLIDKACELKFHTIAITDHDTTAALPEARDLCAGRIRLITGIEFNTIISNEKGQTKDVHILGYHFDDTHLSIRNLIQEQQNARLVQIEKTIALFQEKGHDIEFSDVTKNAGKGSLGRPHICKALMSKGIVKDATKAYRMLMNYDSEFRVERESISPFQAIQAISDAGGVSSIAHPGKEKGIEELIGRLADGGLDGVEVFHRSHGQTLIKKYQRIANRLKLIVTGGSDCHGPFESFPGSIGTVKITPDVVKALDLRAEEKRTRRTDASAVSIH